MAVEHSGGAMARGVVVYTLVTYCATHVCASTPRTSSTSSCWPRSMSTTAIGRQERLEHASGAGMVSGEERLAAQT